MDLSRVKTGYVATVQLLIEADSPAEASDAISEILRANDPHGESALIDWAYLLVGGQQLGPIEYRNVVIPPSYKEGDFVS